MKLNTSRLPWIALAGFLAVALYATWMAAQTADLSFVACHGNYSINQGLSACRRPVYYAYLACTAFFATVVVAGVLIVQHVRSSSRRTA